MGKKAAHDTLPLRTVSRLTGLSADIIRAWEKRYAVVAPKRGPRGARLYTRADVAHLSLLRRVTAAGRAIGDVAKLGRAELDALERFDFAALDRALASALIGLGTRAFRRLVAEPLLDEVGQRWSDGRLS